VEGGAYLPVSILKQVDKQSLNDLVPGTCLPFQVIPEQHCEHRITHPRRLSMPIAKNVPQQEMLAKAKRIRIF
jgi:hypothetical protein